MEATHNRGLGAEQVLAFSLYGSDENLCATEAKGVELVAPAMGSTPQKVLCLADFTQDDAGRISACPHGHSPLSERQNNGSITVAFDAAKRAACPHLKQCPVKKAKKHFCLKVNAKALRIAKRRAFENTQAFHEIYRFRASVEATMSEFDRRAGVRSFTRTRTGRGVLLCRPQSHRYQPTKGHCVPKPQKNQGVLTRIHFYQPLCVCLIPYQRRFTRQNQKSGTSCLKTPLFPCLPSDFAKLSYPWPPDFLLSHHFWADGIYSGLRAGNAKLRATCWLSA